MSDFDERFPRLFDAAYAVSFTIVGDRADAEDVAQEALARAYSRWARINAYAEPWVVRVSGNLAIDRLRRRRPLRTVHERDVPAPAPEPDRVDLQRALRALSRRQREVVVLRYLGDFSEADTARALGCSLGTVKQHGARGLSALRRLLEEVPDVPPPA